MKILKYEVLGYIGMYNPDTEEVEQVKCFTEIKRPYSEANEEIAKEESYNGHYTIEGDGQPNPEPAAVDILNAMLG